MVEDQTYGAIDLFVEADTDALGAGGVFFAVADLLDLEVDLLFFDARPAPSSDATTEAPAPTVRMGRSRSPVRALQGPPGVLPQMVIGLTVSRKRGPGALLVLARGTPSGQAILPEFRDGLRGSRLGQVVTMINRGFSSRETSPTCDAPPRMQDKRTDGDGNAPAHEALSPPGQLQQVHDNLRYKEVRIDSPPGIQWIICRSPTSRTRPGRP